MDYDKLLNQLVTKSQKLFGEDVNTGQNSVLGMYIRVIAWLQSIVNQDIGDVYYNNFVDQATGNALDHLGSNFSINRLPAQTAQVEVTFTGKAGTLIEADTLVTTDDDIEYSLLEDVILDADGKGIGMVECEEAGVIGNAHVGAINQLLENIDGVDSVTNEKVGTSGQDVELDEDYRQRISLSTESVSGPTYYGLYTALYGLSGIQQVQIVPNVTMETDDLGNPPKSLHFYVRGGHRKEIAQTILDNIAAGIQTVGNIKQSVKDIGGHEHEICYDEATTVPIYVQMSIKVSEDYNEEVSNNEIRTAIKDYLTTLNMGDLVVFTRLYQAIYNVNGVEYAQVKFGRSKEGLDTKDIQLDDFETAIVDKDEDIEVVLDE